MNPRLAALFTKHRFIQQPAPENNIKGLYKLVQKYLTNEYIMVEIGCFAGVSSELFAMHVKQIFCVDPFTPYSEIDYSAILEAEKSFDKLLSVYTNIIKLKLTSEAASEQFDNHSLNFVYIDGAHDYDSVFKDIQIWLPKIKPNQYIGGHDFNNKNVYRSIIDSKLNIIETFEEYSWIAKT